jgi:hypothetical protein
MSKKQLSESDICDRFISPSLAQAASPKLSNKKTNVMWRQLVVISAMRARALFLTICKFVAR